MLLAIYRSLTRHRLFAAINIGGLALGIATFLVLFLLVRFEWGFDRSWPGAERLWVVQRTLQLTGALEVPIPSRPEFLPLMRADFPDTVGTRLAGADAAVRLNEGSATEQLGLVDANYFALFPARVLAGDPVAALRTPDGGGERAGRAQLSAPGRRDRPDADARGRRQAAPVPGRGSDRRPAA